MAGWHQAQPARLLYRTNANDDGRNQPPNGFNKPLGILLPKGTADDDTFNSDERSAENTRPLGLKNTDNKAIAAAVNNVIANAITKRADPPKQNGFICGRHGLNNIIDIDARARISDASAAITIAVGQDAVFAPAAETCGAPAGGETGDPAAGGEAGDPAAGGEAGDPAAGGASGGGPTSSMGAVDDGEGRARSLRL